MCSLVLWHIKATPNIIPIPYFTWWNIFYGSLKWQQDPKRSDAEKDQELCLRIKDSEILIRESSLPLFLLFLFSAFLLFFWNLSLLLKEELTRKLALLLHDFVFISCLTGWTILWVLFNICTPVSLFYFVFSFLLFKKWVPHFHNMLELVFIYIFPKPHPFLLYPDKHEIKENCYFFLFS